MTRSPHLFLVSLVLILLTTPAVASASTLAWRIEAFVNNVSQGTAVGGGGSLNVHASPGDTVRFVVGFSGTTSENTSSYNSTVTADDPTEMDYVVGSGADLTGLNYSTLGNPNVSLNDGTPSAGIVSSGFGNVPLGANGNFYLLEYIVQPGLNGDASMDFSVQGSITSVTGQDTISGTAQIRLSEPLIPGITEIINATGDGAGNTLVAPYGVAASASGDVYVTGGGTRNTFKITPGGAVTEIIDETGDGNGKLLIGPGDVAVDGSGTVYVTGSTSHNAFKITPGGVITQIIQFNGDGGGNNLRNPLGIAVDGTGNVYVTGSLSYNAFKITPGGVITKIIDATGDGAGNVFSYPVGFSIAVDVSSNVYVTGSDSNNAFKITPGGVITKIIDATGDGAGKSLSGPNAIAVDIYSGNVYVSGGWSDNAFKITPGGVIAEIIDATGDGAGNTLDTPGGIAVDSWGNVYVAGFDSNNAFKITPGGVITEIIDAMGGGGGTSLSLPRGIAVDGSGDAYVTGALSDNAFKIDGPLAPVPALSLRGTLLVLLLLSLAGALASIVHRRALHRA